MHLASVAVSPFRLGELPNIRTGIATITTAPDAVNIYRAMIDRLWTDAAKGKEGAELDTPAGFDFAGFNGRELGDDAMDVMLTLATNTPLGDGVTPDIGHTRGEFPYFGEPLMNPLRGLVQGDAKK